MDRQAAPRLKHEAPGTSGSQLSEFLPQVPVSADGLGDRPVLCSAAFLALSAIRQLPAVPSFILLASDRHTDG